MDLIPIAYEITSLLPSYDKFGLSDQLRQSTISIPSNIAEGSKRSSRADFRQFCKIAAGSAAELETQLLTVERLYPALPVNPALELLIEIQKNAYSPLPALKQDPINYKPTTIN